MDTNFYLELAGRATGKTYRLVGAVNDWLNQNDLNIAIVYAMGERGKLRIQNDKRIVDKSRVFTTEVTSRVGDIKRFFDDFDFYHEIASKFPLEGYYTSTPAKIRDILDFGKDDFLYKLLEANDWKYVSYLPTGLMDIDLLKASKRGPHFETEILGRWYK